MAKLKLGAIADYKPVKLTVELPATVHRDLAAYAEMHARETGHAVVDPLKLIAPMLARFMSTDRVFGRARRINKAAGEVKTARSPQVNAAKIDQPLPAQSSVFWPVRVSNAFFAQQMR